ncbi:MAG: Uncharacterized protein Athens071416_243 [Parcubacteria group bacterium Athens0714_16]|nr:MAG: Uncharacterized protein Athens071416_243 [Parcubacteria group bacterium Athens0714_16]
MENLLQNKIHPVKFCKAEILSKTKLFNREILLKLAKYGLFVFLLFLIPSNVAHAGWFGDIVMGVLDLTSGTIGQIAAEVLSWLVEFVWIPILSWILTVMGNLLDHSITFSLDMTNISTIPGIKIGWVIVRDLVNMVFIFILLYIAISTILGTDGAASKKTLANMVVAIILINFSMYIAGLIIDAGNIVALTFRNAIVTQGNSGGLGALVMKVSKISESYEPSGFGYTNFISAAVRATLMSVTIYAFFLASMLFVVRIVSFIILLILSPIGFIGSLSPKFAEQSKKWWTTLINQTLVAPVFLFFFYIIAQITSSDGLFRNTLGTKDAMDVTYYFNFVIIIGLILTAVKLSKQFSGELGGKVAGFASTVGKMALGAAGAATLGGLAIAGRGIAGRGASAILSKTGEGLAEAGSKGGIKGLGARFALRGLKGTEKASFDVRGTELGKKTLGLAKGISFGKAGGGGGFKEAVKETAREERKKMGEMFGINEAQKERYAKEVLQKPIWAGGNAVDPSSPLGKMSKNVQAGAMIEKESGIRVELASEIKDLKGYMEQLRTGTDPSGVALTDVNKADIKIKMKDIRENIGYLKEDLKEAAGEAKKKD